MFEAVQALSASHRRMMSSVIRAHSFVPELTLLVGKILLPTIPTLLAGKYRSSFYSAVKFLGIGF